MKTINSFRISWQQCVSKAATGQQQPEKISGTKLNCNCGGIHKRRCYTVVKHDSGPTFLRLVGIKFKII